MTKFPLLPIRKQLLQRLKRLLPTLQQGPHPLLAADITVGEASKPLLIFPQ